MWLKRIWMWLGQMLFVDSLTSAMVNAALVSWLKQSPVPVQLICEASGGYEQTLLESLEQSDVKVTLVQAVRVRQYGRAAGILAKNDKIDAKVLAAFGSALQPKATPPLCAEQKRLRQYEAQRRHLSRVLVAERKSSRASELCRATRFNSQFDQQNQKTN